jgi:hypothetical protein
LSSLSFFRPEFLWALAFCAVPILIHFFQRRRTVRFDFSSVRFLRETAVVASKRKRLRRLLLLLARCAAIACIALLFSQPYNPNDPFGVLRDPQGRTYVWTDPTMSMDYRVDNQPLWRQAALCVSQLDSVLASSHALYAYDESRGGYVDVRLSRERPDFGVRFGPNNLGDAVWAFRRGRAASPHIPLLVLVSDFQAADVGALDTFLAADTLRFPVICVSVVPRRPYNYGIRAIASATRSSPYLGCVVKSQGAELSESGVSVLSGTLRAGHALVHCRADDTARVEIEIGREAGAAFGEVRLDASDPFPHDNVDYFVSGVDEGNRVLVVSPDQSGFPIAKAFESLEPPSLYRVTQRKVSEATFDDLDSADIIVLHAVEQPTRILASLWAGRSLAQKVIVVSPQAQTGVTAFESEVLRYLTAATPALADRGEKTAYPVLPDTLSRLWRGFPRRIEEDARVSRYLKPLAGTPLLRLSDGSTAISQIFDKAKNCWIICATPLGASTANNLCETGFYVPLIDRIARFGLAAVSRDADTWVAGRPQRNPYFGKRTGAQVYAQDGRALAQWHSQPWVALGAPGVYKVQPGDEAAYCIAVHADTAEARFSYRKPVVPKSKRSCVKIVDAAGFADFIKSKKSTNRLHFLWVVLAALLCAEILLWDRRRAG